MKMERIELKAIDLRLSHTRRKDSAQEKRLLVSIQQRDIQEPLQIVNDNQTERFILIDGFKRYRCALKLDIKTVPVEHIGIDITAGILTFLRRSVSGNFSTFEQAALIDELHNSCNMSIYDIATSLERSPAWVSVRLGLFEQLNPLIRQKIMTGAFPVRAYMYDIRGFTRVNKIPAQKVNSCVEALSSKNLSTRELSILIRAYFTGGDQLQRLITEGDVHKVLEMLRRNAENPSPFKKSENHCFIDELKFMVKCIRRISGFEQLLNKADDPLFINSVNIWCTELVSILPSFQKTIRDIYEKTKCPVSSINALSAGAEQKSNSQAFKDRC